MDADGVADAPWHFGTAAQYPALSLDADGDGAGTWEELGRQLRAGPKLAPPVVGSAGVVLAWKPVFTSAWVPSPAVTYTVYRETGDVVETVATGVARLDYTDLGVELGGSYRYQVAAVVDEGESARSALAPVAVPCMYRVEPQHRDVLWTADTGIVAVTTGPGCAWTAASESDFLTVTAGSSGRGSGTVRWAVAANERGPRTGVLVVAGQRVTVFQASPTVFTDHPIERGVTPVRAIHFLELRARIDRLRDRAGLPAFDWTDPTLAPGRTSIKRVHLTELRTALAQASAAGGRREPAYTDPAVTAGTTVIGEAHMMELRAAVLALEN